MRSYRERILAYRAQVSQSPSPPSQPEERQVGVRFPEKKGRRPVAEFYCGSHIARCSLRHYQKLKSLFARSVSRRKKSSITFEEAAFVLLKRYSNVIWLEDSATIGGNMHAAAPKAVFEFLRRRWGVQFECFASPLNCFFSRFFSAFPDTDWLFGSCGSFFDCETMPEGAYEVGPPYTEEVLFMTAQHLDCVLERSGDTPLMFIVFVPNWPECHGVELMRSSRWYVGHVVCLGNKHVYVKGAQHMLDQLLYVAPHATVCFLFQNDGGVAKYGRPTTADLVELAGAWGGAGASAPAPRVRIAPPSDASLASRPHTARFLPGRMLGRHCGGTPEPTQSPPPPCTPPTAKTTDLQHCHAS
eukprot:Polyplicarium_translucidae@DN2624_c0_g1_i4.p1